MVLLDRVKIRSKNQGSSFRPRIQHLICRVIFIVLVFKLNTHTSSFESSKYEGVDDKTQVRQLNVSSNILQYDQRTLSCIKEPFESNMY